MENQEQRVGFDRYFSQVDVWAIAFGCIVGWGAFVMPGTTFLPTAGPVGTVIAMLISVVIMLIIGANYSYLMVHRPGIGGVYSYTKEAFGRDHAFLCAWFLCLSYLTIVFLNGTALFVVIRTLFGDLLQRGVQYKINGNDIYLWEVAVSAAALAVVGVLFIRAKAALQRLHTILAIVLLVGSVIITVVCLPQVRLADVVSSFGADSLSNAHVIFSIVLLSPWAFVGFDVIALETAHFEFPVHKSKRIITLSIVMSGFVYIAMSLASIAAVPEGYVTWRDYFAQLGELSGVTSVPVFYAARAVLGTPGLVIMGITALAAILTGMIGAYRATTRVLSTMAEDRILSEKFSRTRYSILFVMVISILISFLGRNALEWFVELTSFGAIVGFGYTSAAAWKMAKTENNLWIRITSALGTLITGSFALVQMIPRIAALDTMGAEAFLLLSVWCLLGFVFYWRTVRNTSLTQYSGMSASSIVLFSLELYSALMWFSERLLEAESMEQVRHLVLHEGVVLVLLIFVGLIVMLYILNLVRKKHELLEREKIHAVESSLAKSRFLFNMSHDIRTPMNAIIGYTNLAMQEDPPEQVKEYLTKIDTSSRHLLALINDILEMSRIENGKLELEYAPADLQQIMEEVRDLFADQMRNKGITWTVYFSRIKNRYVWVDRNSLNRILLNLVSNAYKFTPEGGTVTAAVWESGSGEDGYGTYELRIEDSGIGMSKEFTEKMFNAFERERTSTVSKVQGTGLGLAITKSLVDLMNGTIEVMSTPGAGTQFVIRLKLRIAGEADVAREQSGEKKDGEAKDGSKGVDFTKLRLLLVEDNEINREIAQMILTQTGFAVETAENGAEAVEMVKASGAGYYDGILMDIQMPVMDGYEATRTIRALEDSALAQIPIIAMTANAFKEDERAALEAGMQAHIAKPLDVEKMMETLAGVLEPGA